MQYSLTDDNLPKFITSSMTPKKKTPRKKTPNKRVKGKQSSVIPNLRENDNPKNSTNPNENNVSSREADEIILESRGGKEFQPIPENRSVVPFREFPKVTPVKEAGLILFRNGMYKTRIGQHLHKGKDWFSYHYKHDVEFKKYVDEIELKIVNEIQGDAVTVAVGMFHILSEIASGKYEFKDKIKAGKLALNYLEKTGRLPKSEELGKEDKTIEQSVQALANSLVEKFGKEFAI